MLDNTNLYNVPSPADPNYGSMSGGAANPSYAASDSDTANFWSFMQRYAQASQQYQPYFQRGNNPWEPHMWNSDWMQNMARFQTQGPPQKKNSNNSMLGMFQGGSGGSGGTGMYQGIGGVGGAGMGGMMSGTVL